jgi:putative transposase
MDEHPANSNQTLIPQVIEVRRKRIGHLDFDRASHCVYHLAVHTVFCVKFRRHILTSEKRDFLYESLRLTAKEVNCEIVEINGEPDHIHFLLRYPPTVELSAIVGILKSKSAKTLLDKFGSFFQGKHSRTVWSSGFFLCSVGGTTLEILKIYLQNQGR